MKMQNNYNNNLKILLKIRILKENFFFNSENQGQYTFVQQKLFSSFQKLGAGGGGQPDNFLGGLIMVKSAPLLNLYGFKSLTSRDKSRVKISKDSKWYAYN